MCVSVCVWGVFWWLLQLVFFCGCFFKCCCGYYFGYVFVAACLWLHFRAWTTVGAVVAL